MLNESIAVASYLPEYQGNTCHECVWNLNVNFSRLDDSYDVDGADAKLGSEQV